MSHLTPDDITLLFLAVGTLLTVAKAFGALARRFNQPEVLGELLAGIALGPTVLGAMEWSGTAALFPQQGAGAVVFESVTILGVVLFLLVAGMEVDLGTIRNQRKAPIAVSVGGMVVPFSLGLAAAWWAPHGLGREETTDPLVFAVFFATALSISALPVIAKTLMDLDLYRTELGVLIITAAFVNDLAGWIIFAVVRSLMEASPARHGLGVSGTIVATLAFAALALTVVRGLIHRALPWIHARTHGPSGALGFALALAMFGAALAEWIGVHAILGAFLVGVAIGDSSHLREQTRATIKHFVSSFFAPLFFASIGLKLNYVTHFDTWLTLTVLVIACLGKVLGCGLSARWSGLEPRTALAIGFGMNARGAMEIILGLLALHYGVISKRMFVALVVMALVTSMMSGPVMQRLLRRSVPRRSRARGVPWMEAESGRRLDPAATAADLSPALGALAGSRGGGRGANEENRL